MSTGFTLEGFPSTGAWVSYALGTENQDLPAYVAIPDPRGDPQQGPANWTNGFLPAVYQGTAFNAGRPINHLARPPEIAPGDDQAARDFLRLLNDEHLKRHPGDTELSARIAAYELAGRMQQSAPEVGDLSRESPATRAPLRPRRPQRRSRRRSAATACSPAGSWSAACGSSRCSTAPSPWAKACSTGTDTGASSPTTTATGRSSTSPPPRSWSTSRRAGCSTTRWSSGPPSSAACPRFRRGPLGRDHNPKGFTAWLAGAGVKRGFSFGATDEFGYQAVENVVDVHDFHATILHCSASTTSGSPTTTTARRAG